MYAVEFEASIKNGIVHVPQEYQEVYNQEKAQIFIISAEKPKNIPEEKKDIFLALLENCPTIAEKELKVWENDIEQGYESWKIEEF